MKETTGELNSAIVVMLAIGILIAFFYYTLWPIIKQNFVSNSQCAKAICDPCDEGVNCKTVTCHLKGSEKEFECVYKG